MILKVTLWLLYPHYEVVILKQSPYELMERVKEAIGLCLEVEESDLHETPDFVGVQKITVEV